MNCCINTCPEILPQSSKSQPCEVFAKTDGNISNQINETVNTLFNDCI